MSVAKVTEISAESTKSFDDAIQLGIDRATQSLRNVQGAWIKDQKIAIENGKPSAYRVLMQITFILDDNQGVDAGEDTKGQQTQSAQKTESQFGSDSDSQN